MRQSRGSRHAGQHCVRTESLSHARTMDPLLLAKLRFADALS